MSSSKNIAIRPERLLISILFALSMFLLLGGTKNLGRNVFGVYEHLPLVCNVKPFPSCHRSTQGFRPFPLHRQGMRAVFQILPQETWWLRNNLARQVQKLCCSERRISFETWKIHIINNEKEATSEEPDFKDLKKGIVGDDEFRISLRNSLGRLIPRKPGRR